MIFKYIFRIGTILSYMYLNLHSFPCLKIMVRMKTVKITKNICKELQISRSIIAEIFLSLKSLRVFLVG